jgi:hypothetical protein
VSFLPSDDKLRKMLPMFKQYARYFPKAQREITKVSVVNNVRYNPERAPNDINWARGKSPFQLDSAFHHMLEHEVDGKIFDEVPPDVQKATGIERVYILAEAAWRIQAELELTIEKVEKAEAEAAKPIPSPFTDQGREAKCGCGKFTFKGLRPGEIVPPVYLPENDVTHLLNEPCFAGPPR